MNLAVFVTWMYLSYLRTYSSQYYMHMYMVAPPGPTRGGGECITYQVWCWIHSKTCPENTLNFINFSVLCTSYRFCFNDFDSLIRKYQENQKRIPFLIWALFTSKLHTLCRFCTSPKPAWEGKNAWFWLPTVHKTCIYSKQSTFWCQKCTNLYMLKKINVLMPKVHKPAYMQAWWLFPIIFWFFWVYAGLVTLPYHFFDFF